MCADELVSVRGVAGGAAGGAPAPRAEDRRPRLAALAAAGRGRHTRRGGQVRPRATRHRRM